MENYNIATYGDRMAEIYDRITRPADTDEAITTLYELSGNGPVLELGTGTGRIAIPLAHMGLALHGIEASPAMIRVLLAKPGGEKVNVSTGDFADVSVNGSFSLILAVFGTIFALPSQERQVHCFRNVAAHLLPDGYFVVEAFVPSPSLFDADRDVRGIRIGLDELVLNVEHHDALEQRIISQQAVINEDRVAFYPMQLRYAWPSQLDLMAQIAGLKLLNRWSDWNRRQFTGDTARYISVYQPLSAVSKGQ